MTAGLPVVPAAPPPLEEVLGSIRGDPGAIRTRAIGFDLASRRVRDLREVIVAALTPSDRWQGQAAGRFGELATAMPGRLEVAAESLGRIGPALRRYADELEACLGQMAQLQAEQTTATAAGSTSTSGPASPSIRTRAEQVVARQHSANQVLGHALNDLARGADLARRYRHDHSLLGRVGSMVGTLGSALGAAGTTAARLASRAADQVEAFDRGVLDATVGTVVNLARLAATDPVALVAAPIRIAEAGWKDPAFLARTFVDWNTLTSDPARWLGRLAPSLLAPMLTEPSMLATQARVWSSTEGALVREYQGLTGTALTSEPITLAKVTGNVARSAATDPGRTLTVAGGPSASAERRRGRLPKPISPAVAPAPAPPPPG